MASGYITFPGIVDPQYAIATRTVGARPDACIIYAREQSGSPDTTGLATLTFGFDGAGCVWTNALCDRGTYVVSTHGNYLVFTILDRRWLWKKNVITRAYNVRFPNGAIDPSTTATLAQIATDLFTAMGEPTADVSAIDSLEDPEVMYDHDNCVDAIEELLQQRGYVIALQVDNTVKVFRRGTGAVLPNNYDLVSANIAIDPPEVPYYLTVLFEKTLVQSKLKCVAVGQDTDGQIKQIANLSYAPAGGWAGTDFATMNFITDPVARQLAIKTVGKWFQVYSQADGSFNIPGYNPDLFEVTSAFQYLPISPYLVSVNDDIFGKTVRDPAYVEGTFYQSDANAQPPVGANTSDFTRVDQRDWTLNKEYGIVMFVDLALKKVSGPTTNLTTADVYLTCTYSIHDNVSFVKERHIRTTVMGGLGTDMERLTEVQRQLIVNYSRAAVVSDVTDNKDDMDYVADQYLEKAVYKYATQVGNILLYRGTYPFSPDGVNLQIRWDCAVPSQDPPWGTHASQYCEGLSQLWTERERALIRRANMTADPTSARKRRFTRDRKRVT